MFNPCYILAVTQNGLIQYMSVPDELWYGSQETILTTSEDGHLVYSITESFARDLTEKADYVTRDLVRLINWLSATHLLDDCFYSNVTVV